MEIGIEGDWLESESTWGSQEPRIIDYTSYINARILSSTVLSTRVLSVLVLSLPFGGGFVILVPNFHPYRSHPPFRYDDRKGGKPASQYRDLNNPLNLISLS